MARKITAILPAFFIVFAFSSNAVACDDKSCENAYLVTAHKYVNNTSRRAVATHSVKAAHSANYKRQQIAVVNERRAHALNRARKDYALHYANYKRQQIALVVERRAYALNRARREYALTHHNQRIASVNRKKQESKKKY